VTAPVSKNVPDVGLVVVVSPSVSPIYFNNPGFTTFDVKLRDDGKKIKLD
jgi:hypothetical protein